MASRGQADIVLLVASLGTSVRIMPCLGVDQRVMTGTQDTTGKVNVLIKGVRRIATRYDKTDTSFRAAIHLVASFLAIK